MEKPNTISVNISKEENIFANKADIYLEIKGNSLISGKSAIAKIKEINELAKSLKKLEIDEKSIRIVSVKTEVSSGLIAKSSSANYLISIEICNLDKMSGILGVITNLKNVRIASLDWHYDKIDEVHESLLSEALEDAEKRAILICNTLKHKKLCVYSLTEKLRDNDKDLHIEFRSSSGGKFYSKNRDEAMNELELDIIHFKTVKLDLRVEYNVELTG